MTGIAPPAQPSGRPHPTDLTRVELTWVEKQIENWIRFGRMVEDTILDRRRRVVGFAPGSVFAFIRWSANDYGTVSSRIDIVRAVAPGAAYTTLPFVRPGGEILLHIHGWPKVETVLQVIDAVEATGIDPADAAPDHWRHVHMGLGHRHERRNHIARIRISGGKGVVTPQSLTHHDAVGPSRPFRRHPAGRRRPKHARAGKRRMQQCPIPCRAAPPLPQYQRGQRGGIDDPLDHQGRNNTCLHRKIRHRRRDVPSQGIHHRRKAQRLAQPRLMKGHGRSRATGTGRPSSSTATMTKRPWMAKQRSPLVRPSAKASTRTIMEVRPTLSTCAAHSNICPTLTGARKSTRSDAAMTTGRRAMRLATTTAALPIRLSAVPANRVPW